jgi:D-xylulose reductase
MAVARAYGARRVIALDVNPARVEFAKGYAAHSGFVCPMAGKDVTDIMEWNDGVARNIMRDLGESAVDIVLEASGAESAMQLGISLLRPGGTCKSRVPLQDWGSLVIVC